MNAFRALPSFVLALLFGASGFAQTLVYDSFPGVSLFSVPDMNSGIEVADLVQLGGAERQLAQIDIGLVAQSGLSGSLRATLYRNDAGGGPGTLIAESNPIAFNFPLNDFFYTFSVTDSDFANPSVIMDDNLYVGVRFDTITRQNQFSLFGVRWAEESAVTPGVNPASESYYVNTGGGWNEESGGVGFGLAFAVRAVDAIPEPATLGLLLMGLAGLLGLRRARAHQS